MTIGPQTLPLGQVDSVRWRDSLRLRIALWSGLVGTLMVGLMIAGMAWHMRGQIDHDARLDTLANAQQAARAA